MFFGVGGKSLYLVGIRYCGKCYVNYLYLIFFLRKEFLVDYFIGEKIDFLGWDWVEV